MYNFTKIRSAKLYQQFSHAYFRQNCPYDLLKIKRKTTEASRTAKRISKRKDFRVKSYNKMKERLDGLEKSLETLYVQNRLLLTSNKDMLKQLLNNRRANDLKINKLLTVTLSLTVSGKGGSINNQTRIDEIKAEIDKLKLATSENSLKKDRDFSIDGGLLDNSKERVLTKIIDNLYKYITVRETPLTTSIDEKKKQAEDKFLSNLFDPILSDKDKVEVAHLEEESDSDSDYQLSVNNSSEYTDYFDDSRCSKNNINFECDKLDLQNNQFTPGVLKPDMYDYTPDIRRKL